MRLAAGIGAAAVTAALTAFPAFAADTGFARWAAVIVSGDDRAAHEDTPTQAFDNARRDVGRALVARGFSVGNMAEFTVDPAGNPEARAVSLADIGQSLKRLAAQAPAGCLFYLTSHGSPWGAVIGERLLAPRALARTLAAACPGRPTVVVISACFSGVFIPALAGSDRLVMTAARRDRSSFGCGESDRYPYFDGCVLETLPAAADFAALADRARRCVARREREQGMAPPSEPQTFVGPRFRSPRFAS